MKVWGQTLTNGVIKLHIQEGIAPYKAIFSMNNNIVKIVTDIPQANFLKPVFTDKGNYDDINCVVENLPAGNYKMIVSDSSIMPELVRISGFSINKKDLARGRIQKIEKINLKIND